MGILRRAAKIDANQPEIVKALCKVGALWVPVGYPFDGLAGFSGRWMPLEIKDGSLPPSKRTLTPAQVDFFRDCEAYSLPAAKVESIEGALVAIGALR